MAALPSSVRRYETWLCSVFSAAGAGSAQTASPGRPGPTTWPACRAKVARTAFRRSPLTGSISPPSMTSTGPSSRTRMTLPVLMRANAPRLGTFGGELRFNESQHFYSCVSDTDKVPRRSAPFHHGPARASGGAGTRTVVDKSVVLRADGDGTRYLLLETIREFGAEKLAADSAEQAELRGRHIARHL